MMMNVYVAECYCIQCRRVWLPLEDSTVYVISSIGHFLYANKHLTIPLYHILVASMVV